MAKVWQVKRNHVMAAKLIVERYEKGLGPEPSPAVIAIANAKRKPVVEEGHSQEPSAD